MWKFTSWNRSKIPRCRCPTSHVVCVVLHALYMAYHWLNIRSVLIEWGMCLWTRRWARRRLGRAARTRTLGTWWLCRSPPLPLWSLGLVTPACVLSFLLPCPGTASAGIPFSCLKEIRRHMINCSFFSFPVPDQVLPGFLSRWRLTMVQIWTREASCVLDKTTFPKRQEYIKTTKTCLYRGSSVSTPCKSGFARTWVAAISESKVFAWINWFTTSWQPNFCSSSALHIHRLDPYVRFLVRCFTWR